MQRNGTEEKMVSLLERPAPCVFVLIHSISFHFIRFHSIFYLEKRNATERNGGREGGREGDREGEKVKNYFYITWKNGVEWNGTERRQGGRGRRGRESKKLFVYYLENGNAPCYADVE
jgi:hypothetical protein